MSKLIPTWLGSFYGATFSFLEYEALTIQHIPAHARQDEAKLMRTKWFDYRRLHPMQASFYFVECYARSYGEFVKMAFDHKGGWSRGIKGKSFLDSREKLSFWRLRQRIDSVGIRYDFFMRHANAWFFKRGWTHLPRPSHIAGNDELFVDVMIGWEDQQKASIEFPSDSWYRVRNYVGHPDQIEFETRLVEAIRLRKVPRFALHNALYKYDALRIERALLEFPQGPLADAISLVKSL